MNVNITTVQLKDDMIAIYIKVHISQRERYMVHTGVKISQQHWNDAAKVVKTSHFQHISFNRKISRLYDLLSSGKVTDYSRKNIDRLLGEKRDSFIDFYEQQLTIDRLRIQPASYTTFKTTLTRLKEFRKDILMSELSYDLIRQFDSFLRNLGLADNTIPKYHKHVRKYITMAVRMKLIRYEDNPYLTFKVPRETVVTRYLTIDELKAIMDTQIEFERLRKVRDCFVFACFTGLSFSDLAAFSRSHIIMENGQLFITLKRTKTSVESNIPLLPQAIEILERYDYQLPVLSNQKYNAYLHELEVICKISQPLTSHLARHTFATMCLNMGIQLKSVSKMLGHSKIQTTERYANVLRSTLIEEMKKVKL